MLPYVNQREKQKVETNQFMGYVHKPYCPDGAWYDVLNLCADENPVLSVREKPYRFLAEYDFVFSKYWRETRESPLEHMLVAIKNTTDDDGKKEHSIYLFSKTKFRHLFGTYPRHVINAVNFGIGIFAQLEAGGEIIDPEKFDSPVSRTDTIAGGLITGEHITLTPCDVEGKVYSDTTVSDSEPEEKTEGMIWVDTKDGGIVFKRWSVSTLQWDAIPHVYTLMQKETPFTEFEAGDAIYFDFDPVNDVNKALLYTVKYIVNKTEDGGLVLVSTIREGTRLPSTSIIKRRTAEMDYITECNNRIWGCKYGPLSDDWRKTINEICCCKLGDPTNWEVYSGISTDAWRASCGTEGPWTGAITYNGSPYFFKEESITKVYVSSTGAHQTTDYKYPGIVEGCKHGADIVGNVVYYKGRKGIYAFDGGQPVLVSAPLGDDNRGPAELYSADGKLYVSKDGKLFVYDPQTKTWWKDQVDESKEARPAVYRSIFISHGKTSGHVEPEYLVKGFYTDFDDLNWSATSGIQFYTTPEKKYIGRYSFRVELEEGSTFELEIEYDSNGEWIPCGSITGDRHGCYTLPVIPRRCDHLRYRISGTGQMKLYSITREMEASTEK